MSRTVGMHSNNNIDVKCGTCARWKARPGEYDMTETYCGLDDRKRLKNDMRGCLGWKEREK